MSAPVVDPFDALLDEAAEDRVVTETGGAMAVLRRGLAVSPELRDGIRFTVLMALFAAAGRIIVPVLIQQILDHGVTGPDGFRPGFVIGACAVATVAVVGVAILFRATYLRLVEASELLLRNLRVRAFTHIHELSLADHTEARRGVLTSRVTSDIETLARFSQWGAIAWIVNTIVVLGVLVVMAVYSWQLALVTIVALAPLLPVMRYFQRRQLAAYDEVRTRVGETLTAVSEAVMGAPVVRAYGLRRRVRGRLEDAIVAQYRAETRASRYVALLFPMSDLFGGLALGAVLGIGAWWGPSWGLDAGSLVACLFLVNLALLPIAELGEILDQTQTAVAGWRKVLDVMDLPVDVVEPDPGVGLAVHPLAVTADRVSFAYRGGGRVLRDVSVEIAAGTSVAVVGETGSGKTTFAKLLCRLADPTEGRILLDGVDLRQVAPAARRAGVRMVPQDGFLFEVSVGDNIAMGREGADADAVAAAVAALGLDRWVAGLPDGLDTAVGERGSSLSVGERQLVALCRAQLADPGLLILDEATSAVDPETEQALAAALTRLSAGRTTVSVAHRLSTAQAADVILVFDAGRIVEQGAHDDLVGAGGRYAELYESWLGNTRTAGGASDDGAAPTPSG